MNIDIQSVTISRTDQHPHKRVQFTLTCDSGAIGLALVVIPDSPEATIPEYQRLAARAAIAALERIAG